MPTLYMKLAEIYEDLKQLISSKVNPHAHTVPLTTHG
jgi:hypothetical protein